MKEAGAADGAIPCSRAEGRSVRAPDSRTFGRLWTSRRLKVRVPELPIDEGAEVLRLSVDQSNELVEDVCRVGTLRDFSVVQGKARRFMSIGQLPVASLALRGHHFSGCGVPGRTFAAVIPGTQIVHWSVIQMRVRIGHLFGEAGVEMRQLRKRPEPRVAGGRCASSGFWR